MALTGLFVAGAGGTVPRCSRRGCEKAGILRPVFFIVLTGRPAVVNRVSPSVHVCPTHQKTLCRYFASPRGQRIVERLLFARCCDTVNWGGSRLVFTTVS
jgi:hypothetical protein